MKHQIEERMDLARQFAKRLMDSEADCKDLEQGLEENPKLKELYDDIATNLHSVNYERTDRQEWIDFQNKFLSRPSHRRNLIVRYAAVASVCIAVLTVLLIYRSRQENVPVQISFVTNLPTISVNDKVYTLDSTGIGQFLQQNHVGVQQVDKELTYVVDSLVPVEQEWHTIRVPRQGEFTLALADGSRVHLNTNTVLRYPVPFSDTTREVWIEGEAFFEVAPDKKKPFVVHFEDNNVTVLGTTFNISCYRERPSCATLLSGSVRLSNLHDSVILRPGQEGIISSTQKQIMVQDADVKVTTAWLNNRFYFKGLPLSEIMETLCDWYDLEVQFDQKSTGDMLFSIETKRYEDIDSVLRILESTRKVSFKRKNQLIEIKSNL